MKSSCFGSEVNDTANLARGYIGDQPETPYPPGNVTGAGGIRSSAEDLLLWSNGISSALLLPRDQVNELLKPRVEWPTWDAYYGYGWMTDRFLFDASKKHTIQYHPGTDLGFYTMLVRQPDKDITIILLNNTGDFPRFDIADLILNELN